MEKITKIGDLYKDQSEDLLKVIRINNDSVIFKVLISKRFPAGFEFRVLWNTSESSTSEYFIRL